MRDLPPWAYALAVKHYAGKGMCFIVPWWSQDVVVQTARAAVDARRERRSGRRACFMEGP